LKRPPGISGEPSPQPSASHRGVTVLSVSALPDDQLHLRRLFDHTKWALFEARTCREAVAILRRQRVGVVICEEELPDGDWRDLLRQLRAIPDVPYLIVTSRLADEQMWVEVLDGGGFNVLEKPFDSTELFRVVSLAWLAWNDRGAGSSRAAAAGAD
jgi:DNA-binding response OmpR family regulator